MDRTEMFPRHQADHIELNLAWASLNVYVDDTEDLQVLVSGAEADVNDLRIAMSGERALVVTQPLYGISYRIGTGRWLQVNLRVPREWKGGLTAYTTTGPMQVRGVQGSDLLLDTVTGEIRAAELRSITLSLKSVSGHILGSELRGNKLQARNVSGHISLSGCSFEEYRLGGVSGSQTVDMTAPFTSVECTTVSGDVALFAPMAAMDAIHRTVSGRLHTAGLSLQEGAPPVRITSVSGNLELSNTVMALENELGAQPMNTMKTMETMEE